MKTNDTDGPSKCDVYGIVTDRIISLLEAGTAPWNKPWSGGAGSTPKNLASGKAYRGINTWLLHAAGFESPYWLTMKQANERGGTIKKGEKSSIAVFFRKLEVGEGDAKKSIPLLRYYRVFNADQTEGVDAPAVNVKKYEHNPIEACEKVVREMPKAPTIETVGGRACYAPSLDVVRMPSADRFETRELYYATLFHELTHATGHASRVGRELGTNFGNDSYSKEELIAEMGSAFLSGHAGIVNAVIDNSASYLQGWINTLKGDSKLVVKAASAAQKASDYILGVPAWSAEKAE